MLQRIISGGQTGVDRGALRACLDYNFPCGGYCPKGRLAEDGIIPPAYPLVELSSNNYLARTIKNIKVSDGTVIIYFDYLEGGTQKTLWHCLQLSKPYKLIDASQVSTKVASKLILAFCDRFEIKILNVAGPRISKFPLSDRYSYKCLSKVIPALIR